MNKNPLTKVNKLRQFALRSKEVSLGRNTARSQTVGDRSIHQVRQRERAEINDPDSGVNKVLQEMRSS